MCRCFTLFLFLLLIRSLCLGQSLLRRVLRQFWVLPPLLFLPILLLPLLSLLLEFPGFRFGLRTRSPILQVMPL